MNERPVLLVTGTSRGIGAHLARYYSGQGFDVVGCSRSPIDSEIDSYEHYCLDVSDESAVKKLFLDLRQKHGRLDVLINNAGIASMNHALLTPISTVHDILNTNVVGTFLFCREAAKLMQKSQFGRIINLSSVAVPMHLEGEAAYVASKAAIVSLTHVLAREFGDLGITVNAVGPGPIMTDLISAVPPEKISDIVARQSIRRMGEPGDVTNVIDFFIKPESGFITGQVIYLGGI